MVKRPQMPDSFLLHPCFFQSLIISRFWSYNHARHHEQNIWKMGGLMSRENHFNHFRGTAALCGIYPLSGFYSKDANVRGRK